MIAWGVAQINFSKSLATIFAGPGGGLLAIAAGTALVAAGAAVSKGAQNFASEAGQGGSGTSGPSRSFQNTSGEQSVKFEPVIINGTDIALILKNTADFDDRATG